MRKKLSEKTKDIFAICAVGLTTAAVLLGASLHGYSANNDIIKTLPAETVSEEIKNGRVKENGILRYYEDGLIKTNSWIKNSDGKWLYVGYNGNPYMFLRTIDGVVYYFDDNGVLFTGWKEISGSWYYFTENGALKGYNDIADGSGNVSTFYFNDNCKLLTDAFTPDGRWADSNGYVGGGEAAKALTGFTYDLSGSIVPGSLSGIEISGKPAEFYMLSIAGETSGGQIVNGDKGRAYGFCQFDYRYDLVGFMRWAYQTHPELWGGFSDYLSLNDGAKELIGNEKITQSFLSARKINYEAAITDELNFIRERYWDGFEAALNNAGFNLEGRHIAVSAAMLSVNVNCGAQPDVFIANLSPDMSDTELICETYKLRNGILSEQIVGRKKKGTSTRYLLAEPQMALDLYFGHTTIDTEKNYGGGVEWRGDIFLDKTTTEAISGESLDWQMVLASLEEEENEPENDVELATPTEISEAVIEEETETPAESFRTAAVGPGGIILDSLSSAK